MTQIVGLVGFIRQTREAYDPAAHDILNPEIHGLHHFYKAMLMAYEMQPVNVMSWSPEDIAAAMRGATLQYDENFAMDMVGQLLSKNKEVVVQDLLAKIYWLYTNGDDDSVNTALLGFYNSAGNGE